jgi:hypothetical protein
LIITNYLLSITTTPALAASIDHPAADPSANAKDPLTVS